MEGGEDAHLALFKSTENTSASSSTLRWQGREDTSEESTFQRHSPVSHEEGGVQHLSLLRFT